MNKVDKIKEIFNKIDPNAELVVEAQGHGAFMVMGPFPSFIFAVEAIGPIRVLIHVNADAANMAYVLSQFEKELEVEYDGAFAIDAESGKLLMNEEAYTKKEDNILMFARNILEGRKSTPKVEKSLILGVNG